MQTTAEISQDAVAAVRQFVLSAKSVPGSPSVKTQFVKTYLGPDVVVRYMSASFPEKMHELIVMLPQLVLAVDTRTIMQFR
jgi:hypothetical protein